MPTITPRPDSLVLYKTRPARVKHLAGKRLEIEREDGGTQKVRPKDIEVLHPGPMESLAYLWTERGEVQTAWELLAGTTTTLAELAELAYGEFSPSTAWAAWELIADGLYFEGTPEAVTARTPEQVAEEQAAREAKAAEERAWAAFLQRVRKGRVAPEDDDFLRDVENLAYGRADKSRVLRELGYPESREGAHRLLLNLGHWDASVDPHPVRLSLPTSPPDVALADLPDEPRLDLTHLPAFAIDDEGNQEPDDAVSLDGERLWVHVADVAALVPPGSPADLEARARGATLFLPEGTVPMLPWAAIEQLGLGLAEISPALSFGLDVSAEGEVTNVEVTPSWVRVTRLTYEEADARLEMEPLRSLDALLQRHRARREAAGAFSLDLPEIKIWVEDGRVVIKPIPPLRSRELVTGAMLAAGVAAARYAQTHGLPLPFTTQDPPGSDERPQPGDLAGMFALRRTMRPSEYSSVPGTHANLGLETYVQATSPLRRYLDLVVHQQLRAHLHGQTPLDSGEIVERVGATSAVSGSVRHAERLARQHWTLVYLLQHPGWRSEGILVERQGSRGLVVLPELDLDTRLSLRGDPELNSRLSLALRDVNLPELRAHFQVVE